MVIGIQHLIRRAFFVTAFAITCSLALADTNVWIKPTDGNWAETDAWSTGQLPSASDQVDITRGSGVNITIDSSTAQVAPSSLSILKLNLWQNTLFLNNTGDAAFHVGAINFSGNGHFIQDGGSSDFGTVLSAGYALFARTNAVVTISNLISVSGTSVQVGGTTRVHSIWYEGGTNIVENGLLHIDGSILCIGDESPITFIQNGGRTEAGPLTMTVNLYHYPLQYALDKNGTLITGDTYIGPYAAFKNISGNHVINGNLVIQGGLSGHYAYGPEYGEYECAGILSATNLTLDQSQGFSRFDASGEVHIAKDILFVGYPDFQSTFSISGLVTCSNLQSRGTDIDIIQTGGALIVSNLLSFSGQLSSNYYGNRPGRLSQYSFSGGTLTANDINLGAEWIIQSGNTPFRVTNPGTFTLGGMIHLIDGEEHLGRVILLSNAVIDLAGSSAKLSFDPSSAEAWNSSATLTVSNWDGSLTGDGVDRLAFGTDATAISAQQLKQIRFVSPSGLTNGIYDAQILSDGEVVPNSFVADVPPSPPPPPPPPAPPPPPFEPTPATFSADISGVETIQVITPFNRAAAGDGVTGLLQLKGHNYRTNHFTQIRISTRGLTAGTYGVTAVVGTNDVPIGVITLVPPKIGRTNGTLISDSETILRNEINARDIRYLIVSTPTNWALIASLSNRPTNSLSFLSGRVRVESITPAVHGSAVLQTLSTRGKQSGHFNMIVAGLAAKATYNLVVNGAQIGTVSSTKNGRVLVSGLPGIDLAKVASVQLQDTNGTVVADAKF